MPPCYFQHWKNAIGNEHTQKWSLYGKRYIKTSPPLHPHLEMDRQGVGASWCQMHRTSNTSTKTLNHQKIQMNVPTTCQPMPAQHNMNKSSSSTNPTKTLGAVPVKPIPEGHSRRLFGQIESPWCQTATVPHQHLWPHCWQTHQNWPQNRWKQ